MAGFLIGAHHERQDGRRRGRDPRVSGVLRRHRLPRDPDQGRPGELSHRGLQLPRHGTDGASRDANGRLVHSARWNWC